MHALTNLKFMFIPNSVDNFLANAINEGSEIDDGSVISADTMGQVYFLKSQMSRRRIAIAICSVAAIAFAALAVTFTSLPIAIIAGISLTTLPILGFLTVQLYNRAVLMRQVILRQAEIDIPSNDDEDGF